MHRGVLGVLILGGALAGGCHTAAGNYFANRARDLGHCFQLEAGFAVGLQADVGLVGLLHLGVGSATVPEGGTLGWCWGEPLLPGLIPADAPEHHVRTSERFYPLASFSICGKVGHFGHWGGAGPGGRHVHVCFDVLPMAYSQTDWLLGPSPEMARWHRVHLCDVQAGFTLGVARVRVGFSPGEFLDFLLGWFGLDIAGDDRAPAAGARASP